MTSPTRRWTVAATTTLGLLALSPAPGVHADPTHYTSLPELQEATLRSTTTAAESSSSSPAGTTITYRFDEPLAADTPAPGGFRLYDTEGVTNVASSATINGSTVTALFPDVDTSEKAAALSLAVVEVDTVHGTAGDANPIGSVGVTRRWTSPVRGLQGCLLATGKTPLRHVGAHTTITFTFTSCGPGDTTADPQLFHLQMVDGRTLQGTRVRYRTADHLTVKISFPGRLARANIGRVTVDAGAMSYEYMSGGSDDQDWNANPLLALPISHDGNTVRPDLVSVTLQPNPRAGGPDHAIFVFDQRVKDPVAKRFMLATHWTGRSATVVPGHPRQVRVKLPPLTSKFSTDANVRDGAVRGGRADEVPFTNILAFSSTTLGQTSRPDLISVQYLNDSLNPLPALTGRFMFDAQLAGVPDTAAFHVYAGNGTRYDADQCTLLPPSDRPTDSMSVQCTFPDAPVADKDRIRTATVEADAVQDTTGLTNPEASHWAY